MNSNNTSINFKTQVHIFLKFIMAFLSLGIYNVFIKKKLAKIT
jgi:hypothetical protein